ncbi:MAG: hypothetical protein IJY25_03865 [Bacilli bacterium]|nr:hypothetical protein [Bacilli bacterium]
MKSIRDKLEIIKELCTPLFSDNTKFDISSEKKNYEKEETLLKSDTKSYNFEGGSINLYLFLLKYPKDVVITYDEYDSLMILVVDIDNEQRVYTNLLSKKSKDVMKLLPRHYELKKMLEDSSMSEMLDYIIDNVR